MSLVLLGGLLVSVTWVLEDARARATRGRPVVARIGSFEIEEPTVWGAGCLVLWVFFFPLYLRARAAE